NEDEPKCARDCTADNDAEPTLELLRGLVAARVELPPSAVRADHSLLNDLHLSSLAVGQIVAEAARRRGLPVPVAPTELAHATLSQLATALDELVCTEAAPGQPGPPSGVDSWIRAFALELIETPAPDPARLFDRLGQGHWRIFGDAGSPFVRSLE